MYLFPEVLEVPARDDGDVDVGHVGEALEALLALGADEGQLGRLGQPGQRPVKVQDHAQLIGKTKTWMTSPQFWGFCTHSPLSLDLKSRNLPYRICIGDSPSQCM